MAALSLIRPSPAVLALGLLAPAALTGCGYTLERTSQIEAREQALAAAETRGQSLQRRIGELEAALAAERRAAQDALEAERRAAEDFAALRRRFRAARVQVAALERSRIATDAPTAVLGDDGTEAAQQRLAELERRVAEEEARREASRAEAERAQQTLAERRQAVTEAERRLRVLRAEAEWRQQTMPERQQVVAAVERRLQALRADATAEAELADRRRELTDLREQIARERAGAAPPAGGGSPPEGGGPPR